MLLFLYITKACKQAVDDVYKGSIEFVAENLNVEGSHHNEFEFEGKRNLKMQGVTKR